MNTITSFRIDLNTVSKTDSKKGASSNNELAPKRGRVLPTVRIRPNVAMNGR